MIIEVAVLLSAFHEKNSNNNSNKSHGKEDKKAFSMAQELGSSGIIEKIIRF